MTTSNIENNSAKLPTSIFRKFFIFTEFWSGTRISPESLLVKTHTGGDASPFFWIGAPNELVDFTNALGTDRSIYCLPNTVNVIPPTTANITAISQYFAQEIVKAYADGPYLIGGLCNSAFSAYETAKILKEQGNEIGLLLMIERDVPNQDLIINFFRKLYWVFETSNRWMIYFSRNPKAIKNFIWSYFSKHILRKQIETNMITDDILIMPDDLAADRTNKENYKLSGYTGNVDLIYVKWGLLGYFNFKYFHKYWKNLATDGFNIHIIDGRFHMPPNWLEIAKITKKILEGHNL